MKIDTKAFLSILIIPLLISCAGTQDLAPDGSSIPIGVNTIIIYSDKPQNEAYSDIGSFLIDQGYSIDNTTPEFHTLTTNYKEANQGYGLFGLVYTSITASVRETDTTSNIILTSNFKTSLDQNSGTKTEQSGQSGSPLRIAWDEFYSLAKSYSDSLTFETR